MESCRNVCVSNLTHKWHIDHRRTFYNRHIGITFCAYYIFSCLSVWQKFFFVAPFNFILVNSFFFIFSASYTFCSFSQNSKSAYGVRVNYLFRWHHIFFVWWKLKKNIHIFTRKFVKLNPNRQIKKSKKFYRNISASYIKWWKVELNWI